MIKDNHCERKGISVYEIYVIHSSLSYEMLATTDSNVEAMWIVRELHKMGHYNVYACLKGY